jgi:hypothetical protein
MRRGVPTRPGLALKDGPGFPTFFPAEGRLNLNREAELEG